MTILNNIININKENRFKNIALMGLKLSGIALVLIFFDSLLRYIIEVYKLINISPFSFAYGKDASTMRNVVGVFIYLSFLYGWYYLAAVAVFHFISKKNGRVTLLNNIVIGITVCFLFFIPYWGIAELFETAILLEGLIVYSVLGTILALFHKQLFGPGKWKV